MRRSLGVLSVGRIGRGYVLSDGLIGWGTPFWGNSIVAAPAPGYSFGRSRVTRHMIPVWASALPLATVFLGCVYAYVFVWPLPFCAESLWFWKAYLFLQNRWGFDIVWNQQIRMKVLSGGAVCWASLDKGVLEALGPRGVTQKVSGWLVPSAQKMQTGAVHDYALLLQILIVVGLLLLCFPVPLATLGGAAKTIALAMILTTLCLSPLNFIIILILRASGLFAALPGSAKKRQGKATAAEQSSRRRSESRPQRQAAESAPRFASGASRRRSAEARIAKQRSWLCSNPIVFKKFSIRASASCHDSFRFCVAILAPLAKKKRRIANRTDAEPESNEFWYVLVYNFCIVWNGCPWYLLESSKFFDYDFVY